MTIPGINMQDLAQKAMEKAGITEKMISDGTPAEPQGDSLPAVEEDKEETEEVEETEEEEEEEPIEEEELEEELPKKPSKKSFQARINQLYREKKEMERYIQGLLTERERSFVPPAQQEREEEPPDFTMMEPAQISSWIGNKIKDEVGKIVKEQITPLRTQVTSDATKADIKTTAKKYPDFWDYQSEMVAFAERHPTLNAEEVYLLATKQPGAVKKSILNRVKEKTALKKAARTEKRTTPSSSALPQKKIKNWKDIGKAVAEEMGLLKN